MAELTTDRIELLSKLYNLRSEDSIITTKIKKDIESINTEKEEKELTRISEENNKKKIEEELETFTNQASNFLECFQNFDNSSFSSLDAIDIHLELGTTLDIVRQKMPTYQESLNKEIATSVEEIDQQTAAIEHLKEELVVQEEKLEQAEQSRQKLNNLLDDVIINKNDSYNRSYVRKILEELTIFNDNEISTLEFLILFPERGLNEYEEEYKDNTSMSSFDTTLFATPEEQITESERITEEPIVEESPVEEIVQENIFAPIIEEEPETINLFSTTEEQVIEEENIEEPMQQEETSNSSMDFLDSIHIESKNISPEGLEIIEQIPQETITMNNEILRSINAEDIIPIVEDGYMYIADMELSQKINLIRAQGINDRVINEELHTGNFKESFLDLEKKINALKENNIHLTEENINLLKVDITKYYENLAVLNKYNIDLDEKEKRNFKELLQTTDYLEADAEILKDYLIKIVRKNGKYALETFWQRPVELASSIDLLLEADLEKLIETNPEILGKNVRIILEIVKYCKENNIPLIEEETNTYYKYIYDYEEFKNIFSDAHFTLDTPNKNQYLRSLNSEIIALLEENFTISAPECEDSLLQVLPIEVINNNVYALDGIKVSKNKVERNISILKDSITEENKVELLLIAMLYNTECSDTELKALVEKYLPYRN